jgi:hypothetical protein
VGFVLAWRLRLRPSRLLLFGDRLVDQLAFATLRQRSPRLLDRIDQRCHFRLLQHRDRGQPNEAVRWMVCFVANRGPCVWRDGDVDNDLAEKLAVSVKYLNSIISAVRDVNVVQGVNSNAESRIWEVLALEITTADTNYYKDDDLN